MVDIEHITYLGRRNFVDLLDMLMIEVTEDVMEKSESNNGLPINLTV